MTIVFADLSYAMEGGRGSEGGREGGKVRDIGREGGRERGT